MYKFSAKVGTLEAVLERPNRRGRVFPEFLNFSHCNARGVGYKSFVLKFIWEKRDDFFDQQGSHVRVMLKAQAACKHLAASGSSTKP